MWGPVPVAERVHLLFLTHAVPLLGMKVLAAVYETALPE